jgi:hypothetical protein
MLCWQLPDRIRVMWHTPEDDGRLRKLHGFIYIRGRGGRKLIFGDGKCL